MFSTGMLLFLKPGCQAEYKRRHDALWPDMAVAMKTAGVSMAIYLHEDKLFIFATARDEQAWNELESDPVTPRWDDFMSDILVSGDDGKPRTEVLSRMFAFGDCSDGAYSPNTRTVLPFCFAASQRNPPEEYASASTPSDG